MHNPMSFVMRLSRLSIVPLLFILVAPSVARGALVIDPREVNLLTQSLVVDFELMALNGQFGSDTNSVLRYGAEIGPNGWTGRMEGEYFGESISVDYTGAYVTTSPTTANITYTSVGTYGSGAWSGGGTFEWDDPPFVGGLAQNGPLGVGIQGGISVGTVFVGVNVRVVKTVPIVGGGGGTLTGEVTAGFINDPFGVGSLIEVGGFFDYDQGTGQDTSGVVTRILWGVAESKSVQNRTQLFTSPTTPPMLPPPATRLPDSSIPDPSLPPGGRGGFPVDPSLAGHEYMYTGVTAVPEPNTMLIWLLLGVLVLADCRRRKRRTA